MRVVFMGTPAFAVPSLRMLADNHEVVAVYTRPDRPRGRGRRLVPTPVKEAAHELGIEVREPVTLTDSTQTDRLSAEHPDVICVAAYGLILPRAILDIPVHGCVNVHASLLPRHRGAAPIHRAILEGDSLTGVSIMLMDEGLDTGPYAITRSTEIADKNVARLEEELAYLGAHALVDTLTQLADETVDWTPQDESLATYAHKVSATDVFLTPTLTVQTALRKVRASTRSARAKVCIMGCVLDLTRACNATGIELEPGMVHADKTGLYLGFSDGVLFAEEMRPEGKSCMDGCSWARGARLDPHATWTPA